MATIDWAVNVTFGSWQIPNKGTIDGSGVAVDRIDVAIPKPTPSTKVKVGVDSTDDLKFLLITSDIADANLAYTVDAQANPVVLDAPLHLFVGSGAAKSALGPSVQVIDFNNGTKGPANITIFVGRTVAP